MKKSVKQIATYRDLPDIYSTDDHVRKLRRSIAAVYYEVYKAAIKRALQEQAISPILRMFLISVYGQWSVRGGIYGAVVCGSRKTFRVQFRTCIYNVWVAAEYLYRKK